MRLFFRSILALLVTTVLVNQVLGAAPAAEQPARLTGDWKLVRLGEDEVKSEDPVTLSVNKEGKVSGSTGVNRFFGGLAKEKTLFGAIGMTRKAGTPETMAREAAYTKALGEVTRFTIEKDKLTLLVEDKPRLVFERIKPAKARGNEVDVKCEAGAHPPLGINRARDL